MERGDGYAIVGECTDHITTNEGAVDNGLDYLHGCGIHQFHDGSQGDIAILGAGEEPVGIDTDQVGVAAFFDGLEF